MNKIKRYKTLIISILFLFFSTSCDELSKVFFPTLEDKIVGNWSLVENNNPYSLTYEKIYFHADKSAELYDDDLQSIAKLLGSSDYKIIAKYEIFSKLDKQNIAIIDKSSRDESLIEIKDDELYLTKEIFGQLYFSKYKREK
jgi:hypothetical protein